MPATYGFIGLGCMGLPMCRNLTQRSEPAATIYVFDVNQSAVDTIVKENPEKVQKCQSPSEVGERADVIFTMLPEGHHVEDVYLTGPKSLNKTSLEGKLLIDCSTIGPDASLSVRDKIKQQFPTARFYDAPVSGGVIGATKATISIFVGCSESSPDFSQVRSYLEWMGKKVVACGGSGLGLTAKLCNNYMTGILNIANAEVFNIGMRAGLDPRKLYDVLGAGSGQNTICDKFCPVPHVDPDSPSSHGYAPGFRMALCLKDMNLASDMASRAGAQMIFGKEALKMFREVGALPEYKDLDVRSVFRFVGGQENWQKKSLEASDEAGEG